MQIYPQISELNKKEKFAQKKKLKDLIVEIVLKWSEQEGLCRRIENMAQCGNWLLFEECLNNPEHLSHLRSGSFCQIRGCPVCEWLRANKNFAKIASKVEELEKMGEDVRYIFLMLTVPNCHGKELKRVIKKMNKALAKMLKRKRFKDVITGHIKVIEVDRNKNLPDHSRFHPHFHILLSVKNSYFENPFTDGEIKKHWADCCPFNYPATGPIIGLRYPDMNKEDKTIAELVFAVAKYVSTPNDEKIEKKIQDGDNNKDPMWEWNIEDIEYYLNGLSHLRLISSGGLLKMKNLDEIDNESQEIDEEKTCPVCSAPVVFVKYVPEEVHGFIKYVRAVVLSQREYKEHIDEMIEQKRRSKKAENDIAMQKIRNKKKRMEEAKAKAKEKDLPVHPGIFELFKIAVNFAGVKF